MKKVKFLSVLLAAMMLCLSFSSCGDDDEEDPQPNNGGTEQNNGSSEQNNGSTINAFFPEGYNASDVEAWYSYAEVQSDGTKMTAAVYIFKDGTVIQANHKIKPDGTEKKVLEFKGTYTVISGDLNNGKISVPEMNMEITIENGSFTAMDEKYTKQDNSKIPTATTATEDNSGNNQGGNDENGENNGNQGGQVENIEAFYPSSYADKTVAGWFASTRVEESKTKITAIFFFDDNSMVVTSRKIYTDGRSESREIQFEGTYTIESGDFEEGVIKGSNGMTITTDKEGFEIENDGIYTLQDNNNVPEATK